MRAVLGEGKKTKIPGARLGVVAAIAVGFVILYASGTGSIAANKAEEDRAEAAAHDCVTSDAEVGKYLDPILTEWVSEKYPGVMHFTYEQWLDMVGTGSTTTFDVAEQAVRELWATGGCQDLHLASDAVEAFNFSLPHDEYQDQPPAGTPPSSGDGTVPIPGGNEDDDDHFGCGWSLRGGVGCGWHW